MKKKIVFCAQALNGGGAEKVTCTLLRQIDTQKYDVHLVLVLAPGVLVKLVPPEVTIHCLNCRKTSLALGAMIKILRKLKPEVIYSSEDTVSVLIKLATYFTPKARIIARMATMPRQALAEKGHGGWRHFLKCLIFKHINLIIAQTSEMKQELIDVYNLNPELVQVFQNPLDTELIDQLSSSESNPFPDGERSILAVGTIYPPKGFDVLIKAMALVAAKPENQDCVLHIIGKDHEENQAKLEALAIDLNINNKVVFHPFTANPYVYMKHCALYVLSSNREGLPNVLQEVLYLGRPAVATDCVPVIKRLIHSGVTGYVVKTGDYTALGEAMCAALAADTVLRPEKFSLENNRKLIEFISGF